MKLSVKEAVRYVQIETYSCKCDSNLLGCNDAVPPGSGTEYKDDKEAIQ
jgi:hypothetical protein